ncbi:HD domain-containing protein [Saccharothrix australiensis]|uniref:HD domain-containing protein n=1 Tax=Saccharothrix australiensis TaxID=2072 RepID=UPI000EAE911D|nr:HD domain-containing protein [Saccharothrix australiensis]
MELVAWAYSVAGELLQDVVPRRWVHVRAVAERARRAGGLFEGDDLDVLVASAVLHDVGYAPAIARTGFHPVDGALYLTELGMPERVCGLVAHHSCARGEASSRGLSEDLAAWADEGTAVRDALWWADMTTGPDGGLVDVQQRIAEIERRYGPDDLVTRFIREARPELVAAVERTEARLRGAQVK